MGKTYKDFNKIRSIKGLNIIPKPKFKGHNKPKDKTTLTEVEDDEEY